MPLLEDLLSGLGYAVDTPGALFRGLLKGRPGQRVSPQELAGRDLGFLGNTAVAMATDPLTWLPFVGPASRAISGGAKGLSLAARLAPVAKTAAAVGTAAGLGTAGAALAGEDDLSPALRGLGYGLMAAPLLPALPGLARGAAAGARALAPSLKRVVREEAGTLQVPLPGGPRPPASAATGTQPPPAFYSRLERALQNAPERFAGRPEVATTKIIPAKTITNRETGEVIKDIPQQEFRKVTRPGQTPHDELLDYLQGKAHPQEIEWVLGKQFANAPEITKQQLLDAYQKGKIDLETLRRGGFRKLLGYHAGTRDVEGRVFSEFPIEPLPSAMGEQTRRDLRTLARNPAGRAPAEIAESRKILIREGSKEQGYSSRVWGFKIPDALKRDVQTKGQPLLSLLPAPLGATLAGTAPEGEEGNRQRALGALLLAGGVGLPVGMALRRRGLAKLPATAQALWRDQSGGIPLPKRKLMQSPEVVSLIAQTKQEAAQLLAANPPRPMTGRQLMETPQGQSLLMDAMARVRYAYQGRPSKALSAAMSDVNTLTNPAISADEKSLIAARLFATWGTEAFTRKRALAGVPGALEQLKRDFGYAINRTTDPLS